MSPLYLIDGFNFLHAVVLKGRERRRWWCTENQLAVRDWVALRLVPGARTWIIFDQRQAAPGGALPEASAGPLEVRYAPDADALILACCEAHARACEVVVVSADRSLVDRARNRGARALSPWEFARYAASGPPGGHPGSERLMDKSNDEERFVRLEVKAAYLEKLALDLNEVVISQGQMIEELRLQVGRVERQLRSPDEVAVPDEKPPHY